MPSQSDRRGRLDMPFVGIPSFLRAAICQDLGELDADVAALGVPQPRWRAARDARAARRPASAATRA